MLPASTIKLSTSFFLVKTSQFLMSDISFNTACKEPKIAQIAQLNQLFQLLHLAHIYGHCFYYVSRMLMSKNVNNDVSKDSPIGSLNNHDDDGNKNPRNLHI